VSSRLAAFLTPLEANPIMVREQRRGALAVDLRVALTKEASAA